jgi:hypothetical protein
MRVRGCSVWKSAPQPDAGRVGSTEFSERRTMTSARRFSRGKCAPAEASGEGTRGGGPFSAWPIESSLHDFYGNSSRTGPDWKSSARRPKPVGSSAADECPSGSQVLPGTKEPTASRGQCDRGGHISCPTKWCSLISRVAGASRRRTSCFVFTGRSRSLAKRRSSAGLATRCRSKTRDPSRCREAGRATGSRRPNHCRRRAAARASG